MIVYNNEPGGVDATLGSPDATRIPAVTITAAASVNLRGLGELADAAAHAVALLAPLRRSG